MNSKPKFAYWFRVGGKWKMTHSFEKARMLERLGFTIVTGNKPKFS